MYEKYRKSWWHIGRITNLDELYKKVIEINGKKYQAMAVRVPLEPF